MNNWNENNEKLNMATLMNSIVRIIGIIIIVISIILGFTIFTEAWLLFENPEAITSFSTTLEKESEINNFVNSVIENSFAEIHNANKNLAELKRQQGNQQAQDPKQVPKLEKLNIAYFIAWFLKICLLLVIARITLCMLSTGGSMATKESNNNAIIAQTVAAVFEEWDKRKEKF